MEEIIVKKRGRGRPPKNGSAPKTKTPTFDANGVEEIVEESLTRNVIIDPLLSPYKIFVDDKQYVVADENRPEGSIVDKIHGYYTSLGTALDKVAKLKMIKDKKFTLREYINEHTKLINDFKALLNR